MNIPSSSSRVRRAVGIDLGTTNSVISLLDDRGGALLTGQDGQGRMTFPSLVGWDPHKKRLVAGPDALALIKGLGPDLTLPLASVKRFMGLDRRFPVGPKSLSPQGASAVVLAGLRDWLQRSLADPAFAVDQAIITMPAYFNHNQIAATRQAGELAGLDVIELLHEPTAAAIYYSWLENHGDATYLVYDLGGGTFDVSIIRRRLDDYEVLSVSGDPFLGGDDFDRLLASHLLEAGTWTVAGQPFDPHALFDPTTPEGALPFARLVRLAESIKCELTAAERVDRTVPAVLSLPDGRDLALEVHVMRDTFHRLIKGKVERTIECCHEALARAHERANVRLGDIDHVILVGGSSRVPLVREVVQAAFCNPALPEHVRNPRPLLHEPDLCVAFGAALRAAGHGTRYLLRVQNALCGAVDDEGESELELHITSPVATRETVYPASGVVLFDPHNKLLERRASILDGGSVRIRSLSTGLIEEAFLDEQGGFQQPVELDAETDNPLEWTVCGGDGRALATVRTTVRHQAAGRPLGQGVLPTQLITKPLSIEVLTRGRQRVKQVVAPVGAALPGTFQAVCRTSDQSGRVVVPIYEENRIVQQLVIEQLDPSLPAGSPVDVEFDIDTKHTIQVRVRVHGGVGQRERIEMATIEPPPSPGRPTRAEIDEVNRTLDALLEQLGGRPRARLRARAEQVRSDLNEALRYDDEPKAIQRMAELRDLVAQAQLARGQTLDPPWPQFARLVKHCLNLAGEVARQTGRDADELFEHVHTQERYAEQAYEELNQPLYRECWENLVKYAGYLEQLLGGGLNSPPARPARPPEEEARAQLEHFRGLLSAVWKQARDRQRPDLEAQLAGIARQAHGLSARQKTEPLAVLRDARTLGVEVEKIRAQLEQSSPLSPPDQAGLLEGSS